MNRWERKGGGNVTLDELELIAETLKISLIEIMGLDTMEHKGFTILDEPSYRFYCYLKQQWEEDNFIETKGVKQKLISAEPKKTK